jgi:hypothetical protein
VPHGPVGDAQILDDLGVSEKELRSLATDAVTEIAESLGASETLETVR